MYIVNMRFPPLFKTRVHFITIVTCEREEKVLLAVQSVWVAEYMTSTLTALCLRWARPPPCRHLQNIRFLSYNAPAIRSSPPYVGPKPTFEAAGIRPPIASALRAAFPNVYHPTKAQNEFIPAILSGKDVLLKDGTGTGKYAIIQSLLLYLAGLIGCPIGPSELF